MIQHRSVLVIEHDMGFVEDIAHKVTVLHQGRVISEGSHRPRQGRPESPWRSILATDPQITECLRPTALHVGYGQSEVLHGLNFKRRRRNEIVVVVGRNGMGKTTLMKSLIGMVPRTSPAASNLLARHDITA